MIRAYGVALSAFIAIATSPTLAVAAQTAGAANSEELLGRIRLLETQIEQMREELARLKDSLQMPQTVETKTTPSAAPPVALKQEQAQRGEPMQSGVAVGRWRVVPHGTVYFNLFGNSGGSNNADIPLFAAAGHGNLSTSARQTRLSLQLEGPELTGGKLTGMLEADFFGGYPGTGVAETFALVRMRLAYARLQWRRAAIVAGQDWAVFAPNSPVSVASAAIPQLATAGNLWQRPPQIRFEVWGGSSVKWLAQTSIVASATGDFPTGPAGVFLLQPGAGARARVPHMQARIAATPQNWLARKQAATFGVSGHYGRARVTAAGGDKEWDVFGAALDWNLPLASGVALLGEAFFGRNLAGFQGGVFQGINADFAFRQDTVLIPGGPRGITSRGGWTQLGITPGGLENLTFYASYGLDDPRDQDLVSVTAQDWRLRNQAFAVSFLHRLSPQLSWGLEFRRMVTQFQLSGQQTNNHINLGVAANF